MRSARETVAEDSVPGARRPLQRRSFSQRRGAPGYAGRVARCRMSFRNRLTVFFIVLVILPMIVVAAVLFRLASDSEQGKTDARLSEAQRSASGLFREEQDRAGNAAREIGARPGARASDPARRPRRDPAPARRARAGQGPARRHEAAVDGAGASRPAAARRDRAGAHAADRRPGATRAATHGLHDRRRAVRGLARSVTGADVVVSSGVTLLASTLPDAGAGAARPRRGRRSAAARCASPASTAGLRRRPRPGPAAGRRALARRASAGPRSRSARCSSAS